MPTADLALVDLREPRLGAASAKALASNTPASALTDLQPEFPNARIARSPFRVATPKAAVVSAAPASSLTPLLVLIDSGNANASYCLAGVIGDGVGTSQVFFNVSELFWLAGGGNFGAPGTQQFTANVRTLGWTLSSPSARISPLPPGTGIPCAPIS